MTAGSIAITAIKSLKAVQAKLSFKKKSQLILILDKACFPLFYYSSPHI